MPIGSKFVLGEAGHSGSRKLPGRSLWYFRATYELFIVSLFEGSVMKPEVIGDWGLLGKTVGTSEDKRTEVVFL